MANSKIRYSVKDVLQIIEDGDSDFGSANEYDTDSSDDEVPVVDVDVIERDESSTDHSDVSDAETVITGDGDVVPPNVTVPVLRTTTAPNKGYTWRNTVFTPPDVTFTGQPLTEPAIYWMCRHLTSIFSNFITTEMAEHTNRYSLQKTGSSIATNRKEMEQVLGLYFRMGLVQMSGYRAYWEADTRYEPVASVMPRNRFLLILSMIHFVDNLEEHNAGDKVWKIRPWLRSFRENCLKVVLEEHNSIDEMMVPFKGKFSRIKQYIRGKPNPWGLKLWARTSSTGILCDFEVYQGRILNQPKSVLGVGADVVLKLSDTLPVDQHYKVYADNFLSSLPLVAELQKKKIQYVGTIRSNRLKGCTMTNDKDLLKRGRGSFDSRVERNDNIVVVKWVDTKVVTAISSMAGATPTEDVQRWSSAEKNFITVQRPYVLSLYNTHMGGVDLLDCFLATNRKRMVSRRWYIYLFWHTVYIGMVNSWLLYKRDCVQLNTPKQHIMRRRRFQANLASSLIGVNAVSSKRGRPSLDGEDAVTQPKKGTRIYNTSAHGPTDDVRLDEVAHMSEKRKRGRCRHCVKQQTNT